MSFEILPDELLLIVCSYLNGIDALRAFYNLNTRLNSTISHYTKQINLSRIRYNQFNQYCDMLIQTNLGLQLKSLSLSNNQLTFNRITLFTEQVWPLNEKLPNLECLTLSEITYDELNMFLPDLMSFEKLRELSITCHRRFYDKPVWEIFRNLTKNIHSLRKITFADVFLSLESIYDWNNDTITHMTIQIKTTDDLIIILQHFSNLHFLNVSIIEFEIPHANHSFDKISSTQLNKFHMKILGASDRSMIGKMTSIIMNIRDLQHVKYEICLDSLRENENIVAYLNGREWDLIRTHFDHLVDFDCMIWIEQRWSDMSDVGQQIIASFSQFSAWSVDVFKGLDKPCICVFTKTLKLLEATIDHRTLRNLNTHQIATLIDRASSIYMYTVYPYNGDADDDENFEDKDAIEDLSLVLTDRIFSKLDCLTVGADCYMYFNKRLESFLKQLFSRTPNLESIEISSSGGRDDYRNISAVLNCFEKPSISIRHCKIYVEADYDESCMEEILSHLPMLTSLTIDILYECEHLIAIVNACLIHAKHLLYLQLAMPYEISDSEISDMKKNSQLWLKENTHLSDPIVGREFQAIIDHSVTIWL